MTFSHDFPISDEQFLRMGDFATQVEVIYGSLWISKWPGRFDQLRAARLWREMWEPAHAAAITS